jgi:hypothetical protein
VKVREHLTYANVAATLALVGVLGGGGAYAAGVIDSGDIENNSVASRDLENRRGVTGRDVRRNSLTGRELREKTLSARLFAPMSDATDHDGCNPNIGLGQLSCARTSMNTQSSGRSLVIASGEFSGSPAARLECRIAVDGELTNALATPEGDDEDTFTITSVTGRLAKGSRSFALRCEETSADGRLERASIAVLGISG